VQKVESLRELDRPDVLSTAVAVATVKRYLPESRHRIRLHDLFSEETEMVYEALASDRFATQRAPMNTDAFQERMRLYEAAVERLMAMMAALSYHDAGENAPILTRCIQRLAQPPRQDGLVPMVTLQFYPALLLCYASGISALAARRFRDLAAVLTEPRYLDHSCNQKKPAIDKLNTCSVFERTSKLVPRPNAAREYTPVSEYFLDVLRPVLREYLPDEAGYQEAFDLFEYVLALTHMDLVRDTWSPVGRFGWRYKHNWDASPLAEFARASIQQGPEWGLLGAGFFGGSADRFKTIAASHKEFLQKATGQWM
jgi:hypothetical protein